MHARQARLSPPGSPAVRVARQWWLFALPIQREGRQTARGQIGPLSSFVAPGGWLFSLPVPVLSGFFQEKDDEPSTPGAHHPSRVAHKALCQPRHILSDRPRQSSNDRACFPSFLQREGRRTAPESSTVPTRVARGPWQSRPPSLSGSSAVTEKDDERAPVRLHHHSLFARACHRGRR